MPTKAGGAQALKGKGGGGSEELPGLPHRTSTRATRPTQGLRRGDTNLLPPTSPPSPGAGGERLSPSAPTRCPAAHTRNPSRPRDTHTHTRTDPDPLPSPLLVPPHQRAHQPSVQLGLSLAGARRDPGVLGIAQALGGGRGSFHDGGIKRGSRYRSAGGTNHLRRRTRKRLPLVNLPPEGRGRRSFGGLGGVRGWAG